MDAGAPSGRLDLRLSSVVNVLGALRALTGTRFITSALARPRPFESEDLIDHGAKSNEGDDTYRVNSLPIGEEASIESLP